MTDPTQTVNTSAPTTELKVEVQLRLAKTKDFYSEKTIDQKTNPVKIRHVGIPFWLVGERGDLQKHRLTDFSNVDAINQFINAGRCYVMKEDEI